MVRRQDSIYWTTPNQYWTEGGVDYIKQITLTKEFCAQPLRLLQKKELEKDIQYRCIKNLSGFIGFTSDYRS